MLIKQIYDYDHVLNFYSSGWSYYTKIMIPNFYNNCHIISCITNLNIVVKK